MIFDNFLGMFSTDMAIDLGTANTLVSVKDRGIIINEPSVVVVKYKKYGEQKVLAIGKQAKNMAGKIPRDMKLIRPLRDGVIADFETTEKMIRYFIEKAHRRSSLVRPRIAICIPHGITGVERRAVRDAAYSAGARDVFLVEEPMAAALGAGIPIHSSTGNMVVDIGGGTTEIGVTSLGGQIVCNSTRVGGDRFDKAIIDFVRLKHNLYIGEQTAERLKWVIGSAYPMQAKNATVKGRDGGGLLIEKSITSEDMALALAEPLREISVSIRAILDEIPPDLAGDIIENGIVLTGGGSLLKGFDLYIKKHIKLNAKLCDEPLLAVARGTAKVLQDKKLLETLSTK